MTKNEIEKKNWLPWLIIGFLILYIVSPVDAIPDEIPVVGWIDDALAALLIIRELYIALQG